MKSDEEYVRQFIRVVIYIGNMMPVFVAGYVIAFFTMGIFDAFMIMMGAVLGAGCFYMAKRIEDSVAWQKEKKKG